MSGLQLQGATSPVFGEPESERASHEGPHSCGHGWISAAIGVLFGCFGRTNRRPVYLVI